MTEENKDIQAPPKEPGTELEKGFFDDDEVLKSKSKLPLYIGLGAAAILIIVLIIVFSGSSLSSDDMKVFDTAADALRTDDYANYPAAEKKLLALAEKYPDEPLVISWLAQLYLAWGDALGTETAILEPKAQEAQTLVTKIIEDMKKARGRRKKAALEKALLEGKKQMDDINKLYEFRRVEATKKKNAGFDWAKKGIQAKSSDYRSYRAISDYFRIMRNWSKAEEQLDYVGKAKPESAGLRFIKGAIFMERDKNFGKAIALYKEALSKDPKFIKAKYFMGLAQDTKGDKEAAKKTMEEVVKMSPKHPGATVYLKMTTVFDLVKKNLEVAANITPEQDAAEAEAEAKAEGEKAGNAAKKSKKKKKSRRKSKKRRK